MKNIYQIGDTIAIEKIVNDEDVAAFNGQVVHQVCSTFVLAREIEWATRQFVLNMKEDDEEGIGTMLNINHKAPAFIGEIIVIIGTVKRIERNEIICSYEAKVGDRVIATGETGQKILKKDMIQQIFSKFAAP